MGLIATLAFAWAFLIAPAAVAAQHGVSGWNPGALVVARLFGAARLFLANAAALASLAATAVSAHAVPGGLPPVGERPR